MIGLLIFAIVLAIGRLIGLSVDTCIGIAFGLWICFAILYVFIW